MTQGYTDIIGYDDDDDDDLDLFASGEIAIGYDEIIGDGLSAIGNDNGSDDLDMLELLAASGMVANDNAGAQLARLKRQAAQMSLAKQVDSKAVLVEDRPVSKRRRYPLGFSSPASTPAGGSGTAKASPQVTFRPETLIVTSDIAPYFTIDDIIIGKNSQSVSAEPLPAAMFTEVAVNTGLNLDTANLGTQMSLRFTNVDAAAHTFRASLVGTAVE